MSTFPPRSAFSAQEGWMIFREGEAVHLPPKKELQPIGADPVIGVSGCTFQTVKGDAEIFSRGDTARIPLIDGKWLISAPNTAFPELKKVSPVAAWPSELHILGLGELLLEKSHTDFLLVALHREVLTVAFYESGRLTDFLTQKMPGETEICRQIKNLREKLSKTGAPVFYFQPALAFLSIDLPQARVMDPGLIFPEPVLRGLFELERKRPEHSRDLLPPELRQRRKSKQTARRLRVVLLLGLISSLAFTGISLVRHHLAAKGVESALQTLDNLQSKNHSEVKLLEKNFAEKMRLFTLRSRIHKTPLNVALFLRQLGGTLGVQVQNVFLEQRKSTYVAQVEVHTTVSADMLKNLSKIPAVKNVRLLEKHLFELELR